MPPAGNPIIESFRLPGKSGSVYLDSLPRDMAGNPNYSRVMSPELYAKVVEDAGAFVRYEKTINPGDLIAVEQIVRAELKRLGNPYHGWSHTQQVRQRAAFLAEMAGLADQERVLLDLAALFHDFDHCGSTHRQLVKTAVRNDMSNEEFAALQADLYLGDYLGVRQRLQLQGLILSTSAGQADAAGLPEIEGACLLRPYRPCTVLEKLLTFADIGRFILGVDAHMEGALLLLRENGCAPSSFDEWLSVETEFVKYVQGRWDELQGLLSQGGKRMIQSAMDNLTRHFGRLAQSGSAERDALEVRFNSVRTAMSLCSGDAA